MAQVTPIRLVPVPKAAPLHLVPVVLIADSRPTLLEILRDTLERDRFRVLTATNGQEALALAETTMPDVLVSDVVMPCLDGLGLVRAVRRLYPSMPVIVMSGDDCYAGRPIEDVAVEFGAAATLMKPFDLAVLHEAIRSVVPLLDTASPHARP
jgi:DNA-binding response OmpR family regulator